MSQQEMDYSEMKRESPGHSYRSYEGVPHYNMAGEKFSAYVVGVSPTPGQRLALAITSLSMLMIMTFSLIAIAASLHAPDWAIFPILFMLVLFSSVAVIINIVFNRQH